MPPIDCEQEADLLDVSTLPNDFGRLLKAWYVNRSLPRHKILSLFSGGGGLDIAFHEAGFEVVEMVEKDPSCVRTLKYNSEPNRSLAGSCSTCIEVEDYEPNVNCTIDFIIGGPPCQSFSAAGRRMAGVSGTDSPNGKLFEHYVRILKQLQPRGFLFENVLGLLSAQQGSAWRAMRNAFIEAGYQPFVHVMDAADYGVPQHRERVIVIGLRDGEFGFPLPTHGPRSISGNLYTTAEQAFYNIPVSGNDPLPSPPAGKYGHLLKDVPPGLNYTYYTERMGHPQPIFSWRSKFSDFLYKADPKEPTRTIKANGGPFNGPFHWDGRQFTLAELKRLQTFPDDYELIGSRPVSYRQLGNAVPPQLGRILALALREQIFNEIIPIKLTYFPIGDDTKLYRPKHLKTEIYRRKAKEAYTVRSISEQQVDRELKYLRYLTKKFGWQREPEVDSILYRVRTKLDGTIWKIKVERVEDGKVSRKRIHYSVLLKPNSSWPITATEIHLQATDALDQTLTACWKAFEEVLRKETHLADLVQLSGYYTYPQRFKVQLRSKPEIMMPSWYLVVQCVSSGRGVGKLNDEVKLATCWNILRSEVRGCLARLRQLGFEVRSHSINSQIPEGHYLVPYSFPTLSPKSLLRSKEIIILTAKND
jgi:DNA (cytosine-5)-methyltransferase 1